MTATKIKSTPELTAAITETNQLLGVELDAQADYWPRDIRNICEALRERQGRTSPIAQRLQLAAGLIL